MAIFFIQIGDMMVEGSIWRPPLDNLLFERNLALLKNNTLASVDFYGELSKKITLFHSKSGLPTAKYGNILLHSKYDPEKEGMDFAKNIKPGSRLCLYGFGLGYHLPPLLEKIGSTGFLLVIELNKDILTTALKL